MKHIIEQFDEKLYTNPVLERYFGGMNIGVLDIETTGLNPSRNKFILGGLYNSGTGQMHQIFAETRQEEAEALLEYMNEISKVDMLVTYNGKHFDIPFLEKRIEVLSGEGKYQENDRRDIPYNLDLYLLVNGHSPIKKLVPNLKQKTVENYMGLWETRADEISGAESVELYNHYEATADPEAEQKILLHNNDDVRQLTRLMKVVSKCNLHKGMYSLGFPVGKLKVDKPHINRDHLLIEGRQLKTGSTDHAPIDYAGYSLGDYPAQSRFRSEDAYFGFKIPIIRDSGLTVVDLEAAGMNIEEFQPYPSCENGFLVIEDREGIRHMELNHFIIEFIRKFQREELL